MRALNSLRQIYRRLSTKHPFRDRIVSYCALCGDLCSKNQDISSICDPCRFDLPFIQNPCPTCSTTMATNNEVRYCGNCLDSKPYYQSSIIPLEYAYPNTIFVKRLKYKDKLLFSEVLSKILLNSIQLKPQTLPECIIPVPLHSIRLIKRGYNQSELIAHYLAKQLMIPIDYTSCKRIKNTKQQTSSNAAQREQNLRNAFTVSPKFTYKHVAIVDDVVTTGSTVNELAKILSKTGVETIDIWACTRTGFNLNNN